jgi:chromosome segregation ATPase
MVTRVVFIAFISLIPVVPSVGQTRDRDSETLHEILAEIRAIHNDMRASETTQLLVAELGIQQNVVSRDTESVDSASAKLNDVRRIEKQQTDRLEEAEERLNKTTNAVEQKNLSDEIEAEKSTIIALKSAERDCSTTVQNMEQRLQSAQDKLASIEAELSTAMSRIAPTTKGTGQK